MQIKKSGYPLRVIPGLIKILTSELDKAGFPSQQSAVINFRSPGYSPTTGGYHPVEIFIDAQGRIQYLTDFAYVGMGEMAELAKELDFDFSQGMFQQFGAHFNIRRGREIFQVWQQNFCTYYASGVYEVSVVPS